MVIALLANQVACESDSAVGDGPAAPDVLEQRDGPGDDDRAHLRQVREADSLLAARDALPGTWNDIAMYQRAVGVVRAKAWTQLDYLVATRDHAALEALADTIAELDAGLENRARGWSELFAAQECSTAKDWVCVAEQLSTAHTRPLPWRARQLGVALGDEAIPVLDRAATTWPRRGGLAKQQAHLQAMVESGEAYEKLTGTPPPTLDKARTRLAAVIERLADKRARDAERKRRRSERKAAKAQRAFNREWDRATKRSSGGGNVRCCDGTTSPTCTYDRASLRGCCSHHGGVC